MLPALLSNAGSTLLFRIPSVWVLRRVLGLQHQGITAELKLMAGSQLGAAIYALRVPERWYPGAFDLWFSSHQLFHLCVVAAALVHYGGVRTLLDWRDSSGGCSSML